MGLLSKSLKKTGQERTAKPKPAEKAEEKPSVGWLGRTFSERTRALTDKIDLESQYARLEALSQTGEIPPPPKASLRERAKRFLTGLSTPGKPQIDERVVDERPKLSLRQKAAMLMRKIGGFGGEGGDAGGMAGKAETGSAGAPPKSGADAHPLDDELPAPGFFPWHALSEEGALQSHIAFGEEPHPEHFMVTAESTPAPEAALIPEEAKSPLSAFAETMERITENLKNLHVQLDSHLPGGPGLTGGNFIRDVQVERPPAPPAAADQPPLISHHVPIETQVQGAVAGAAPGGIPGGGGGGTFISTGAGPAAAPPGAQAMPAPQEKPKDVFWPKDLPLDMPARDIKLNADGSVSVVPGPFQLPYLAEDIAPPESAISHFTRNLKNAETFIGEGELQLTRIIYERLLTKIADEEAQRKIKANLEALDNYKKSHDWGNFMPVPPWQQPPWAGRNPWQDVPPPRVSVSEMPVEAKNITINMDKGFFEIARSIFELKDAIQEKKGEAGAGEGEEAAAEGEAGADAEGEDAERRGGADRRQGGVDPRGEGAPDRRKGEGRRAEDGGGGAADEAATPEEAGEEELRTGEDRRKGEPDPRGEGAEERRTGRDRRVDEGDRRDEGFEQNAPPPPLAADGQGAAEEEPTADGVMEPPKIPDMSPDGQAMSPGGGDDEGGSGEDKEEENKVQEIRGVLELKTPDQEDTPFLTLTYDFTKIPHAYRLAKDNGIFEYAYYKYKPMLVKAHQFIKRKQITRALNYYRVIREQQIPTEFRHMVDRNIKDITEYLQKYLVTRAS